MEDLYRLRQIITIGSFHSSFISQFWTLHTTKQTYQIFAIHGTWSGPKVPPRIDDFEYDMTVRFKDLIDPSWSFLPTIRGPFFTKLRFYCQTNRSMDIALRWTVRIDFNFHLIDLIDFDRFRATRMYYD